MKHWNLNSQVVYILFRFLSVGIEEKNFEFHRSALETSTFVYNQFLWKVWILLQNPLKLYAVRVCWALAADIKHFFLPWNFFYPEMLKSTRNSVSGFHALLTRTCVWLTRAILRIRVEFFFFLYLNLKCQLPRRFTCSSSSTFLSFMFVPLLKANTIKDANTNYHVTSYDYSVLNLLVYFTSSLQV